MNEELDICQLEFLFEYSHLLHMSENSESVLSFFDLASVVYKTGFSIGMEKPFLDEEEYKDEYQKLIPKEALDAIGKNLEHIRLFHLNTFVAGALFGKVLKTQTAF